MTESNSNMIINESLPVLPLRDIVVFPHMIVPLFVGREKSIQALEEAMGTGKNILLVAQRDAKIDDPTPEEINKVGTLSSILLRSLVATLIIWSARYALLWAGFPSLIFSEGIFDPMFFASKFGGGLAKSIAEMTVTSLG